MNEQWCRVLDTNILVSRLLCPDGVDAKAVDHALALGVLLVSEYTLNELVEVLSRPKFDPYTTREDRQHCLELLGGVAPFVPIVRHIRACRDPKDDRFPDVALNGEATAIITGDQDPLVLDPCMLGRPPRIVQPLALSQATRIPWSPRPRRFQDAGSTVRQIR